MKINLFGSTGFVGKNITNYFKSKYDLNPILNINNYDKQADIFINLIGKAHDVKKVINPSDYYYANTILSQQVFDAFLLSNATVFITLSSVKAVADSIQVPLTENHVPNPITHYGKSKLLAEEYILNKEIPKGKRVYILRPCMIHGPGNKGNLTLIYEIVNKGIPWPLGKYNNKRSFCSIENICFIINELLENDQIPSGVYNVADDESVSTNNVIQLISESLYKKPYILNIPKFFINGVSKLGDTFKLPLNSERLSKLTETYVVSNQKIINAINKPLPISARAGLLKTFNSFLNA
jgi:nucleoside-diphosphate-sugar epimerase